MQSAISIPWRAAFAVAVLALGANVIMRAEAPRAAIPIIIVSVPPATATTFSLEFELPSNVVFETVDDYLAADRLARAVEARRYGEIDPALAAIDPHSMYSAWVPAAIGLAVEQIDTTSAAYARMHMCSELFAFVARIEQEWPAGAAARAHFECNASRAPAMPLIDALEHASLEAKVLVAGAVGDHAAALEACSTMRFSGDIDPMCLAEACRAGDLPTADVLFEATDNQGRLWRKSDPRWQAREACANAGVNFWRGQARAGGLRTASSLVRVHPDAPIREEPISDW